MNNSKSKSAFEKAKKFIAGGVNSPVRAFANVGTTPRFIERAKGSKIYDIDGNGTQELIIGGGEDASNPWNYDLYTYDGSKVVHVFPDFEFGYRTNFSLYENGIIEVFYSGSAAESGNDFYRMNAAGTGAEIVENFSIIGSLDGDTTVITYYQGKNVITEDEYNRKTEEYEVALQTPFSWTEIK